MNFKGRYFTRNGMLVAVHSNPDAKGGDREIRWKGHTIALSNTFGLEKVVMTDVSVASELWLVWNENGECVKIDGVSYDAVKLTEFDLAQTVEGSDKYIKIREIKVVGCKECNSDGE